MTTSITCLVTIHGIGFQHAPQGDIPGYADVLHARLQARLPSILSGDPASEFGRPAGVGAVYVHSDWPPGSGRTDEGLKRLGRWQEGDDSHRDLDITDVPLAVDGRSLAHVALVYAGLEERESHLGAAIETLAKAAWGRKKYATLPGLFSMAAQDAWAVVHHQRSAEPQITPSLQVRAPEVGTHQGVQADSSPSGPLSTIAQLDQDVSTYVVRNDLRTRVRSFAHEAILRICSRPDVEHVVVNAHSQGTVLAFDVLRELPPFAASKVKAFITAGSPLRKYADLFFWGSDAGVIHQVPWSNFWDPTDPVADPLEPPASWRRGEGLPPSSGVSQLYSSVDQDSGEILQVQLTDITVENIAHGARGGLASHNYWDNEDQFVAPVAKMLESIASGTAS